MSTLVASIPILTAKTCVLTLYPYCITFSMYILTAVLYNFLRC